ncbi:hypothetical protein ACFX13_035206 [Malus domestica]
MVDRLFDDIFQILRLNPNGKKFDKVTRGNRKTLADEYEYVMQGKLFKISEGSKRDPKTSANTESPPSIANPLAQAAACSSSLAAISSLSVNSTLSSPAR